MNRWNSTGLQRGLLGACLMVSAAFAAQATSTQIRTISEFDEFRAGEPENVSLTSTGEITLAPRIGGLPGSVLAHAPPSQVGAWLQWRRMVGV